MRDCCSTVGNKKFRIWPDKIQSCPPHPGKGRRTGSGRSHSCGCCGDMTLWFRKREGDRTCLHSGSQTGNVSSGPPTQRSVEVVKAYGLFAKRTCGARPARVLQMRDVLSKQTMPGNPAKRLSPFSAGHTNGSRRTNAIFLESRGAGQPVIKRAPLKVAEVQRKETLIGVTTGLEEHKPRTPSSVLRARACHA